jgi:phospholipid/cholesterol/gamma-HCH transport system substrate-binding protein
MRDQRLNYAVVGVFVLTMLASVLVAAVMLSGRTVASDDYVVVFDNVADVKFGTQVRFEGYPVGQVEAIEPLTEADKTRFRLMVSVERGWRIPADSVARIGSSSFLGAKTVDIQQGKASEALAPGDRIIGAPSVDVFAAFSDVAAEVADIARNDLRGLLTRITNLVESANALVETDFKAVLGSVGGAAANLEQRVPAITGELLLFTKQLNETAARMQRLLSAENVEGVGQVIRNVEETSRRFVELTAEVQGTLEQFDAILADVGRIVESNEGKLDATVEDARYTLQAIARNIDSINHNLNGAARNMNEFSRLIRQNPGLLLDSSPRREVKNGEAAFSLGRKDDR